MDVELIENPEFLSALDEQQLTGLANDIRHFIIESIAQTGGHLSSNLGVVELTIALHKVFNAPIDKIFFDVGHQAYTHKILTGRAKDFSSLRAYQGLSGFQKRNESIYDCFEAGHSSTTISAAVGMAVARDLNNEDYHIVPIIGDGSLTGGIALEALNHLGYIQKKVIIILNDNEMSISKNVGGLDNLLGHLRISMPYNKAKQNYKELLNRNSFGRVIYKSSKFIKDSIKEKVISNYFTDIGLDYIGPLDGHDFKDLLRGLEKAKNSNRPIVVHVLTKKGKGYKFAEEDTSGQWHGTSKFDPITGQPINIPSSDMISYSKLVADCLYKQMEKNEDIVAITPAMITGSKLEEIFNDFPNRAFDVGIAEEHASEFAAGLALAGKKPYLSVYSTFSQRAYDQFNHDLARMNLGVVIGLDRAGLVGEDGETHHGIFDIALYRNLPNFIITAPKDASEIASLFDLAFSLNSPFIIRYPRGNTFNNIQEEVIKLGEWKHLINNNQKSVIITYGPHSQKFNELINNNYPIDLVHALFIKPMDTKLLDKIFKEYDNIIVYEPDIKAGGFSSAILEYANDNNLDCTKIIRYGIEDEFIPAGPTNILLEEYNLAYDRLINDIIGRFKC